MFSRRMSMVGAGLAAIALSALPTAAHADGPKEEGGVTITHCNGSSQADYMEFPHHGGIASYVINPGTCGSFEVSRLTNDMVVGHRYSNGLWPQVAVRYFNGNNGNFHFNF